MKRKLYLVSVFAFLILQPQMATADHVVTLRTDQATEITIPLGTTDGIPFGSMRIRFNYNVNSSGEHIVGMEINSTIGQQRIMVFERRGDLQYVVNAMRSIQSDLVMSGVFLSEMSLEKEVKSFILSKPAAIKLKDGFSWGAYSFNMFGRFPLLLDPSRLPSNNKVLLTLKMYGIADNQLNYSLEPVEIEVNFPGMNLIVSETEGVLEDSKDELDDGTNDNDESQPDNWQCDWMLDNLGESITTQETRYAEYNLAARLQNFSRRYQDLENAHISSQDTRAREQSYQQAQRLASEINSTSNIIYLARHIYDSLLVQLDYLPLECNTLPYEDRLKANLAEIGQQQQMLNTLNTDVQEIMRLLDAKTTNKMDSLNLVLLPVFTRLTNELSKLETAYALLRNEFDFMKVSPRYFVRQQIKFDRQTSLLNDSLINLQKQYEQILAETQTLFSELWGMEQPLWSDEVKRLQQNFDKGRQVLAKRLEQIKEEISTYAPRPLPWLLISVVAFLGTMVVFGIVMLSLSIRTRRKKASNKIQADQLNEPPYTVNLDDESEQKHQQENNNDTSQNRIKI